MPGPRRPRVDMRLALSKLALKMKAHADLGGDLFQRRRHFQRVRPAFELARPGDQRQRQRVTESNSAKGNGGVGCQSLVHDLRFPYAERTMKRHPTTVNFSVCA